MVSSRVCKAVLLAALPVIALAASGCQATYNQRGYVAPANMSKLIRVGVDNKASLETSLGSPSTIGTFNENIWYYISSVQEDLLFFKPEETQRQVVAVLFDANQTVAGVKTLTLADGAEVDFSDRETPARGRELTFLQQIFGNVGRGSPIGDLNNPENDPRERR